MDEIEELKRSLRRLAIQAQSHCEKHRLFKPTPGRLRQADYEALGRRIADALEAVARSAPPSSPAPGAGPGAPQRARASKIFDR